MLARGTPWWIGIFSLISIIPILFYRGGGQPIFIVLAALPLVLNIPLILFFRDPKRRIGDGVVSPADGRVLEVYRDGRYHRINIFMNIHNVHVNRVPVDCQVISVERKHGGYIPAFDKGSERNERVITTIKTRYGTWTITQIAGAVARRIVPYVNGGEELRRGERLGLIRFGSRVDLKFALPKGMEILVKPGDRVLAGASCLAAPLKGRDHR